MSGHRKRAAGLALALVVGACLTACGDEDGDREGGCTEQPAQRTIPWYPTELTLPEGSFQAGETRGADTHQHRGVLVVPTDLETFLSFTRTRWPQQGIKVQPGESEEHDAEFGIVGTDGHPAAISAVEHSCPEPWTEVTLIMS